MLLSPRRVLNACRARETCPPASTVSSNSRAASWSQLPGILERLDLRGGLRSVLLSKEDVVRRVRVEGRIEIDEIHRLVWDVPAEHVQVVAVVEPVLPVSHPRRELYRQDRAAANAPGRVSSTNDRRMSERRRSSGNVRRLAVLYGKGS